MANEKAVKAPVKMQLQAVEYGKPADRVEVATLKTNAGDIHCRLHGSPGKGRAVVWVGGAGGGLDGPAGGLYPRLAGQLLQDGIASLRLEYRRPNYLPDCVVDTLMGIAYLQTLEYQRFALVGHSFGGAVVISAGALSNAVVGVAALSSQTYGADAAARLKPVRLLLMHGSADSVLPDLCSRQLYDMAQEPKELRLYPGCGHGLDECRAAVDRDLLTWIRGVFGT